MPLDHERLSECEPAARQRSLPRILVGERDRVGRKRMTLQHDLHAVQEPPFERERRQRINVLRIEQLHRAHLLAVDVDRDGAEGESFFDVEGHGALLSGAVKLSGARGAWRARRGRGCHWGRG